MKPKKELELEGLAKTFVSKNLSAAGFSYIVNSKSPIRRLLWFLGVIVCMAFMGYMTINVILQYLGYPKMLVKEDVILPKLPFPAVTICSLNPIRQQYVNKTALKKILDMKDYLNKAKINSNDEVFRRKCYDNPLCQWSWFREKCSCIENACLTEFCLAENETHCNCSKIFCDGYDVPSCKNITFDGHRSCVCSGDSTTKTKTQKERDEEIELEKLLSLVEGHDVRKVIRLIKRAKSNDLVDVEEAFLPTTEELYDYGSPFDSLITACSFEGNPCNRENFTVLFHPNYGKCYMFNYVGKNEKNTEKVINTMSYGGNSGLQLLLRVEDRHVIDLFRREIGARIVIHDPSALPFVSEYGINVRPRDMTAIELSQSSIERLDKPWGDCMKKEYTPLNQEPYSILGCEKQCGINYITSKCNCTMRHLLRGTVLISKPPPYPLCDYSNDTQRECAMQSADDIERRSGVCNCIPPCSETRYTYAVTASELNENYYRTVKAVETLLSDGNGDMTFANVSDEKSMLGVKVYFNAFMVSIHKEVASYSWETLVANIGGSLGFFMGLTLVTFFEITEFLWDLLLIVCNRFPSSRRNTVDKLDQRFFYPREGSKKRRIGKKNNIKYFT